MNSDDVKKLVYLVMYIIIGLIIAAALVFIGVLIAVMWYHFIPACTCNQNITVIVPKCSTGPVNNYYTVYNYGTPTPTPTLPVHNTTPPGDSSPEIIVYYPPVSNPGPCEAGSWEYYPIPREIGCP